MNKCALLVSTSIVATSVFLAGCSSSNSDENESDSPSPDKVQLQTKADAILGGTNVSQAEFTESYPWMASVYALVDANPRTSRFFCGGVVIGDQWVLTAAHCVEFLRNLTPSIGLVVGVGNTKEEKTRRINVDAAYLHPAWIKLAQKYPGDPLPPSEKSKGDLALLHLKKDAGVKPIAYIDSIDQERRLAPPGTSALTFGWGDTTPSFDFDPPEKLQQIPFQISDREACRSLDPNLDRTELCAIVGPEGRDTCFGDSGGPLVVKNRQGKLVLAGLLSWGGENQISEENPDGLLCGVPGAVNGFARTAVLGSWVQKCTEKENRCGTNVIPFRP